MMFTQVMLFASIVMSSSYPARPRIGGINYGSGPSSTGTGFPSYGGGAGRGQVQNEAPKPYNFDYSINDGQGNVHFRSEEGDQNGRVKGTYGYSDYQGLYRCVEYTADENGYRAIVWTNEPGVDGKEYPADVVMYAEQPPAGIYGPARGYGTSRPSGQGGSGTGAGQGGFSAGSSGASRHFCGGTGVAWSPDQQIGGLIPGTQAEPLPGQPGYQGPSTPGRKGDDGLPTNPLKTAKEVRKKGEPDEQKKNMTGNKTNTQKMFKHTMVYYTYEDESERI